MSNPNMYLIYIDESYDTSHYAYSCLFINAFKWNTYFEKILQWRREWHKQHQIPLDYELHATKFIGGRGEFPVNGNKIYRSSLFHEAIGRIETMEDIMVMNAITKTKRKHMVLFEYMLNRINRTLEAQNAFCVLICDEGNEDKLTSTVRKMKKENIVPLMGQIGTYTDFPLNRIIEDPLFKTSKASYFIQLADLLAFALLRNEKPIEGTTLEFTQSAFEQLDKVLVKQAFAKDPRKKGIIRV